MEITMAKKGGKSKGFISQGQRPNYSRNIVNASRREYVGTQAQLNAKVKAWREGKRVMLTIDNPDKKNTKERKIRVPAIDVWGFPRSMQLRMR
jgi:hypothetical protein